MCNIARIKITKNDNNLVENNDYLLKNYKFKIKYMNYYKINLLF
jgi:hypothetical protein